MDPYDWADENLRFCSYKEHKHAITITANESTINNLDIMLTDECTVLNDEFSTLLTNKEETFVKPKPINASVENGPETRPSETSKLSVPKMMRSVPT